MSSMLRRFALAAFVGTMPSSGFSAINHTFNDNKELLSHNASITTPQFLKPCSQDTIQFNLEFLNEMNLFLGGVKDMGRQLGLYKPELISKVFSKAPRTPEFRELQRWLKIPIASRYDAGTEKGLNFLSSHHTHVKMALNDYALFISGLERVSNKDLPRILQQNIKPMFQAYLEAVGSVYEDIARSERCANLFGMGLRR